MRSSLIVLAVVLATLRAFEAFARRMRRASLVPVARRRGSAVFGASELSLAVGEAVRRGTAETGRKRGGKGAAAGDRTPNRYTEWRYYGFSSHAAEVDASIEAPKVEAPREIVASSPAVGSVVTILPDDCITTVVNGSVYRQCGSVWYQRQYTGSDVRYVVVPAP
jgi:hypothetical protein